MFCLASLTCLKVFWNQSNKDKWNQETILRFKSFALESLPPCEELCARLLYFADPSRLLSMEDEPLWRHQASVLAWSFVSKLITKFKMQLKIKWVEINKLNLLSPHMSLQTSPWSRGHLQLRVTSCLWRHALIGKSEAKGWQAFSAIHYRYTKIHYRDRKIHHIPFSNHSKEM
jgi:hypothetical protein